MKSFPNYKQLDQMDCGPSCLRIIAKHYGKSYTLQHLRSLCFIDRQGVSFQGISQAAETIGMRTKSYRLTFEDLLKIKMPCIAHWNQNHFVVVYKIKKNKVWVSDPALGLVTYTTEEFKKYWISTVKGEYEQGIIMEIEPSATFYQKDDVKQKSGFGFLFNYLRQYKGLIFQLVLGMLAGSLIQLIFPFLTQSIVDFGINNQDLNFIFLILIGQLVLFAGQTTVELIRSWILLHIGTRVNISLISDFLMKLLRLPMNFFDSKMIGDILQRINDHSRVEHFLTATSLSALFSVFNIIVFGFVLFLYSKLIFLIFFVSSLLYVLWILLFLKKRAKIDHEKFSELSQNRSHLIQLISGVQDIKLNNSESQMRWDWEHIQAKLFKVNIKALSLDQFQTIGGKVINQTKNFLIIYVAAMSVIEGDGFTLGMMLAVQFIVGQLNTPVEQLINFVRDAQDAKISLERISEVHDNENEEDLNQGKIDIIPENGSINLKNVNFRYGGPKLPLTLSNINLSIPHGKTTAIVGTSGSGKTTLLKLMLKFYNPESGEISLDSANIKNIRNSSWRKRVGVVMQDGFIFSDTIAKNIAVGADIIDTERLLHAVEVANIREHVESLPLGYNTKIGNEGIGLSAGQKQRILIARAVYKNPDYLFLDEATNALDANNEKAITKNLDTFLENKTVVVVAHRLSTVKNADQIIVLDKGEIIEKGTHSELTSIKGAYYNLVKNQLELGN